MTRYLPEPTDADLVQQDQQAWRLFDHIAKECEIAGVDKLGTAYSLWTLLTRLLVEGGWTPEELLKDCGWHAADQGSEGRA